MNSTGPGGCADGIVPTTWSDAVADDVQGTTVRALRREREWDIQAITVEGGLCKALELIACRKGHAPGDLQGHRIEPYHLRRGWGKTAVSAQRVSGVSESDPSAKTLCVEQSVKPQSGGVEYIDVPVGVRLSTHIHILDDRKRHRVDGLQMRVAAGIRIGEIKHVDFGIRRHGVSVRRGWMRRQGQMLGDFPGSQVDNVQRIRVRGGIECGDAVDRRALAATGDCKLVPALVSPWLRSPWQTCVRSPP